MELLEDRPLDTWLEYLPTVSLLRSALHLSNDEFSELFNLNDIRSVNRWFRGQWAPRDPDEILNTLEALNKEENDYAAWHIQNLPSLTNKDETVYYDAETNTVYLRYYSHNERYLEISEEAQTGLSYKRYRSRLDRLYLILCCQGYNVTCLYR